MSDLAGIVRLLKKERDRLTKDLHGISAALAAFGNTFGKGTGTRTLSAEARARIAAAQRKRWAKVRETAKAVPIGAKRTMSAAALTVTFSDGTFENKKGPDSLSTPKAWEEYRDRDEQIAGWYSPMQWKGKSLWTIEKQSFPGMAEGSKKEVNHHAFIECFERNGDVTTTIAGTSLRCAGRLRGQPNMALDQL